MSERLPAAAGSRGVLRELVLFLPHFVVLLRRLLGDSRVPRRSKLVLCGTMLYLVSPIDVIPDFVPGLGQVDDLVVVLLALHSLLNHVDEKVVLEHWEGNEDVMRLIRRGLAAVSRILPGDLKERV
ncbi:MAG: YkvA family protein [Gemmatimonadota bacterium]